MLKVSDVVTLTCDLDLAHMVITARAPEVTPEDHSSQFLTALDDAFVKTRHLVP